MSISKVKNDVLNIFDLEPDWINSQLKNPLKLVVTNSKSHELLLMLRLIFGVVDGNPLVKRINKFHYSQEKIQITLDKIVKMEKILNTSKSYSHNLIVDVISLLSQIEFLKVYPNRFSDTFIKAVLKNNFISAIHNRSYKAKSIYLLTKMGFGNIFIDRELKVFETSQNLDGGWGEKRGDSSKVFTSVLIFQCLRENRMWKNKETTQKVESYLIKNHLSKNETKADQDKWSRIHSGYKPNNMFEGGSLMFLESMLVSPSDKNKNKVKAIINWLKDLQMDSGLFPYHADLKKQENLISTIRVLACMKKKYLQNNLIS